VSTIHNDRGRPTLFINIEVTASRMCQVIEMNGHGCPWSTHTVALNPNDVRTQRVVRGVAGNLARYEWAMGIIERGYAEARRVRAAALSAKNESGTHS
jgi:hypothetical protein